MNKLAAEIGVYKMSVRDTDKAIVIFRFPQNKYATFCEGLQIPKNKNTRFKLTVYTEKEMTYAVVTPFEFGAKLLERDSRHYDIMFSTADAVDVGKFCSFTKASNLAFRNGVLYFQLSSMRKPVRRAKNSISVAPLDKSKPPKRTVSLREQRRTCTLSYSEVLKVYEKVPSRLTREAWELLSTVGLGSCLLEEKQVEYQAAILELHSALKHQRILVK
jgi:hypothetical protein